MTPLGRRIRYRPPTDADERALVDLMRARLAEFKAGPTHIDDSLSYYWNQPGLDRTRHQLVATVGRRVVGTALSWPDPGEGRMTMFAYVTPRARGRGIGTRLVSWFDDLARAEGVAVAGVDVPAEDPTAMRIVERAGYRRERTFRKLEHRHPGSVAERAPPAGILYTTAVDVPSIPRTLTEAYRDTFADHFDYRPESYEAHIIPWIARDVFDPALVTFARGPEGELAGYLMVLLTQEGTDRAGDVDELGVVPSWRKRGLGSALLAHGIRQLVARGATRITIGVDVENPNDAGGMYERVGFTRVSEGHVYRKRLRPEVDAAGLADEGGP